MMSDQEDRKQTGQTGQEETPTTHHPQRFPLRGEPSPSSGVASGLDCWDESRALEDGARVLSWETARRYVASWSRESEDRQRRFLGFCLESMEFCAGVSRPGSQRKGYLDAADVIRERLAELSD